MTLRPFLILALSGGLLFGIGAFTTFLSDPNVAPEELPRFLREASGLAVVDETQLLSHNDEKGHIYSIRLPDFQVIQLASLGKPAISDDFEGIAAADNLVYLITSTGKLYVVPDVLFDVSGQLVNWQVLDTGLAAICEIEGLHNDNGTLLIPCKNIFRDKHQEQGKTDKIRVYAFRPGKDTNASLLFSLDDKGLKGGRKKVTGIHSDPAAYYLLTQETVIRVERETLSLEIFLLDTDIHKQPEGIAITENGEVYLVDDRKKGTGGLTHYNSLEAITQPYTQP